MQQSRVKAGGQVYTRLREHMTRYGYESIETPIIDSADLFLTKAGDQIINKLFTFERYGRQLALRPEFTAAAARRYILNPEYQGSIVRWQFSGAVFADDPDDYTQNYQRQSIGAELIGMAGPEAEAEIIGMAAQGIMALEVKHWQLTIGHVGLMRQLLARFDLDSRTQRFLLNNRMALKNSELGKDHVIKQLDIFLLGREQPETATAYAGDTDITAELNAQYILDVLLDATERGVTMGGRTRHDIARRLLQKRKRAAEREQILAALDFLTSWGEICVSAEEDFQTIQPFIAADDNLAHHLLAEWRQVMTLLDAYEVPREKIKIQPDLARNWDYYTGIVFELSTDDGLHLGGGGRYDELAQLIGGQRDVPAVGFAYYADQLFYTLPIEIASHMNPLVISMDEHCPQTAVQWAQMLRQRGIIVVVAPQTALSQAAVSVTVQDDLAFFGHKSYNWSQIDVLITDLKQAGRI